MRRAIRIGVSSVFHPWPKISCASPRATTPFRFVIPHAQRNAFGMIQPARFDLRRTVVLACVAALIASFTFASRAAEIPEAATFKLTLQKRVEAPDGFKLTTTAETWEIGRAHV